MGEGLPTLKMASRGRNFATNAIPACPRVYPQAFAHWPGTTPDRSDYSQHGVIIGIPWSAVADHGGFYRVV